MSTSGAAVVYCTFSCVVIPKHIPLPSAVQVPKFVLNTRSPATTPKQQTSSRSSCRPRPSSTSPLPTSQSPSLPGPLSLDPASTWQPSGATPSGCRCPASPQNRQQEQQGSDSALPFGASSSNGNGDYRLGLLGARRSKSFNSLDSCLLQQQQQLS